MNDTYLYFVTIHLDGGKHSYVELNTVILGGANWYCTWRERYFLFHKTFKNENIQRKGKKSVHKFHYTTPLKGFYFATLYQKHSKSWINNISCISAPHNFKNIIVSPSVYWTLHRRGATLISLFWFYNKKRIKKLKCATKNKTTKCW